MELKLRSLVKNEKGETDWTKIFGYILWSIALIFVGIGIGGCAGWGNTQYITSTKIIQGAGGDGGQQAGGAGAGGNVAVVENKAQQDAETPASFGLGDSSIPSVGSIVSDLKPNVNKPVDNSNTDNRVDNSIRMTYASNPDDEFVEPEPGSIEPGEPVKPEPDVVAGFTEKETYRSYGERNGGRKAWRIPKKGTAFGKELIVVFSDGHTVHVKDTSHNYREKDGFVFKPGLGPNGTGDANTGTAHGGIYLHAPYGNKSMDATIKYKKQ
jgi:hypothetical protein